MVGNLIWNFSFALFGFSLFFLLSFPGGRPVSVLTGSFLAFIIFFILMFVVRYLLYRSMEVPTASGDNQSGQALQPAEKPAEETSKKQVQKEYDEKEIASVIKNLIKEE